MVGFTEEEAFLNNLATKSFLRFWSWPNLFRDQGDVGKGGDGKEICDLAIIFGKNIILFSDKKSEYDQVKGGLIAWNRWARKAIKNSLKQIDGARRWFLNHADRIYLDNKCTIKLPLNLPKKEDVKIYSVIVCHGIEDALSEINDEHSFSFDNSIVDDDHWDSIKAKPFTVGKFSGDNFIHIFNESTIDTVLDEFDTTPDFISYLDQREKLILSEKSIRLKSESDIIQLYYESFDDEIVGYDILKAKDVQGDLINIDKGGMSKLFSNPYFVGKKISDRVSYFWDELIDNFTFHILNGSSDYKNWNSPEEIEPHIRIMAECGRFERRVLSEAFISFYEKAVPGQRGTRLYFNPLNKNQAYLFLVVPFNNSFSTMEQYREVRRAMLEEYCYINKYKSPEIIKFVGIACRTREGNRKIDNDFFSEGQDFIFVDTSSWGDKDFSHASSLYEEYLSNGLIAKREFYLENKTQFPVENNGELVFSNMSDLKGRNRNMPCICGSGKKAKKCCFRN